MRIAIGVVVLLAACGGGQPKGTAAPEGSCEVKPLIGSFTVMYRVTPNYEMKEKGPGIIYVRDAVRAAVEAGVSGSLLTLTEAQGVEPDIYVDISLLNDGYENYNLSVRVSFPARNWGDIEYWEQTYTDPDRMTADYGQAIARAMVYGKPC